MLVDRDRSFRNWSIHQNKYPRWVSPHGSAVASVGQQALARTQSGKPGRKIKNFDHPAAARILKSATDALGLNGMTMHQTRHSGACIDRVRGFRTLQEVQKRSQWKAFSSVARYDKSSRLATDYHCLLRNKLITIAQRAEVLWTKQLQVGRLTNAWLGEHTIDVFGGNGFLTKATNQ